MIRSDSTFCGGVQLGTEHAGRTRRRWAVGVLSLLAVVLVLVAFSSSLGAAATDETTVNETTVSGLSHGHDDAYEPNDNLTAATPISENETLTAPRIVADDVDFYSVALSDGERLTASIDFDHDAANLQLGIMNDPSGPGTDVSRYSSSDTDGESVSLVTVADEQYYVGVYSGRSATANYTLSTSVSDAPDNDAYEPNDERSAAATLTPGTAVDARIVGQESDYYAVELDASEQLQATAAFVHSRSDLDLALLGPDGAVLDRSTSTSDGEFVNTAASTPGTYYLHMYNYGSTTTNYTLSTRVSQLPADDAYEPNDDRSSAVPIQPGETLSALRTIGEDPDYYAIEVGSGERLMASMTASDLSSELTVDLLGPNGTELDSSRSVAGNASVATITSTVGTYYLRGYSDADTVVNYTLSTSVRDLPDNDAYEPNDDLRGATDIAANETLTTPRIVAGDVDIYSLALSDGERLTVSIDFDHDAADLQLAVLNNQSRPSEDVSAYSESDTDGESASLTTVADEQYYVAVYSEDDRTANYTLSTSVERLGGDDRYEPNDDRSNATAIEPGTTVEDATLVGAESDYYAVDVDDGAQLRASLSFDDSVSDRDLEVLSPNGTVLFGEYRSAGNASAAAVVSANGTYFVRVSDPAGNTTAEYELSVEVTTPDESVNVTLDGADAPVPVDGTSTVNVYAEAPRGVQGYDFNVSLGGASAASITDVAFPHSPSFSTVEIESENATAHVESGYADALGPDDPTLLATLTLAGERDGQTTLTVSNLTIADDDITPYLVPDTVETTLNVSSVQRPTLPDQARPAASVDDDPLLEDVNGDGQADLFDALTYYNERDSAAIQNNPSLFDFDGDGQAGTLFDALELYNDIS